MDALLVFIYLGAFAKFRKGFEEANLCLRGLLDVCVCVCVRMCVEGEGVLRVAEWVEAFISLLLYHV